MPQSPGGPGEYSIAAVSKLTGIGCHALRVWERRYEFPVPHRTPSGHRRYSADQVKLLDHVARCHRNGMSLADAIAEVQSDPLRITSSAGTGPCPVDHKDSMLRALLEGDVDAAESAYHLAVWGMPGLEILSLVIQPALVQIGELWYQGECEIFQEHFASEYLRGKIVILLEKARAENTRPSRKALIGTLEGDRHEGGVLMLAAVLEISGWRAILLGVDIPTDEIQKAVLRWKPDVVCLSFVLSRNVNKRFEELSKVAGAPIYLGGRSILNYQKLARRHGIHPLHGPFEDAVRRMIAEVEAAERDVG